MFSRGPLHAEHNNAIIKTSEDFFKKNIPLTLFERLRVWEGVGDRTELQYIDPHSYGHQRGVFLVLQCCSTRGPGAQLSAECWLSLPHLVTNFWSPNSLGVLRAPSPGWRFSLPHLVTNFWSPNSLGVLWAPSAGWWFSLPHLVSKSSDLQLTDFLSSPSYIIGASVYECTMGFYLVPYCQPSPPMRFLLITAIGMCYFLPVHHFGMACLAGSKVNIQHSHWQADVRWQVRINLQQLCMDTPVSIQSCQKDLPEVMVDRDKSQEKAREICASSTTWWWWWYMYVCV